MNDIILSIQEYSTLVEQSPIMIWRANVDTLCDYFNERWLSFRGRTMEQEYGNGWAEPGGQVNKSPLAFPAYGSFSTTASMNHSGMWRD